MKTIVQKSNALKSKIFLQKSLILFAIITFTSFGFNAMAQQVHFDVDNNLGSPSGCDWQITAYDNATPPNILTQWTVPSGTRYQNCRSITGTLDHLTVDDGTCVETFGSGGVFSYASVNPCGGTTCSSSIDCSGGQPGTCIPAAGYIIIRIY